MKNLIIVTLSVVTISASAVLTNARGRGAHKDLAAANNPASLVVTGPHR